MLSVFFIRAIVRNGLFADLAIAGQAIYLQNELLYLQVSRFY
ncbi:hypothetical protein KIS4809_1480 [Bacillus sp. ZZV12-4809]|nr:hypothetical protein KIS4809_1480 [Bacillus sp. ZZV12-4809]